MSKTIGLTTYSISVRDENNHQYELHDILGWSLIEYFETIANEEKGKYEDDHIKENLFAFNEVFSETIEDKHGKAQYDRFSINWHQKGVSDSKGTVFSASRL